MFTAKAWLNHQNRVRECQFQDGGRATEEGSLWQLYSAQETETEAWEAMAEYVVNHNAAVRRSQLGGSGHSCWTLGPASFRRIESNTILRFSDGHMEASFIHTSPAQVPLSLTSASGYAVKYCLGCRGWQHMTRDQVGWYRCWSCGYTRNVDGI